MWLILSVLFSCQLPDVSEPIEEIVIPDIEIQHDDPRVSLIDGFLYFDGEPFSGYLLAYDENNILSFRKGHFAGQQHGLTYFYYPNGELKERRLYSHGEKHGEHFGFYSNGKQSFSYYFEHGFNEGNHREWYPSGELYTDMNYKSGKEFGTQRIWRPDGKLRANYIVRENGRRYGLQGIKRCTKLDGNTKTIDPYDEDNN